MKKSSKIILGIIVVLIVIFVIYKVDSMRRVEERITEMAQNLLTGITNEDYEKIRNNLRSVEGNELSDQEITNFLLNTELYRATLLDNGGVIYDVNVNFFNINEGNIVFGFTALNGENITRELKYVKNGTYSYFVTEETEECIKEKESYPIDTDLADGTELKYNTSEDSPDTKLKIYVFKQDENGGISLEIIKEAKEDIERKIELGMNEEIKTLKNINDNYTMEFDNEYKKVSVYYSETDKNKVGIKALPLKVMLYSITKQALSGNPDWKLTIDYYDYNTRELLSEQVIR